MIHITDEDKQQLIYILDNIRKSGHDDSIESIQKMLRKGLKSSSIDLSNPEYVESITRDFINPTLKDMVREKEALRKEALNILITASATDLQLSSGITPSMTARLRKEYSAVNERFLQIKIDTYPLTYLGYELKKIQFELNLTKTA